MTCSRCGAAAPPNARFCPECGNALQASCGQCGSPLIPGAKFCAECGTPTGAGGANGATSGATPANAVATNGPVAERRLVSILFADLVGFTERSDEADPEDVRRTLVPFHERARDAIERFRSEEHTSELQSPC